MDCPHTPCEHIGQTRHCFETNVERHGSADYFKCRHCDYAAKRQCFVVRHSESDHKRLLARLNGGKKSARKCFLFFLFLKTVFNFCSRNYSGQCGQAPRQLESELRRSWRTAGRNAKESSRWWQCPRKTDRPSLPPLRPLEPSRARPEPFLGLGRGARPAEKTARGEEAGGNKSARNCFF